MASHYTEHYNLCQWEPTDQVQRTDFNADNAKTADRWPFPNRRLSR